MLINSTVMAPSATASVLFGITLRRSAHASLKKESDHSNKSLNSLVLPCKNNESLSII